MKKNISSRVMSAVLGAALLVSSGVPVYALGTGNSDVTLQVETGEEPSIVSVKVPTEIPLKMDKEGVVTVPQDLKITNLISYSTILISSPALTTPPFRTLPNIPSLGITQSPTRFLISHPWWHSFPI